jgi:hypothetical protein
MIEHRGCCAAAGLGIDVSVIRGARRTAIGLAARVASSAVALLVASTLAALSQSAFDFTKSIDPLFAGVLAQPSNLNNTIQYAVTAASQGDIESAISARDRPTETCR